MNQDHVALLADGRVSSDARLFGLVIQGMGEGWHEISHNRFRAIVSNGASDETIRRRLRELEASGWIERKPGGSGSPRYRFVPLAEADNRPFREALAQTLPEILPHTPEGQSDSTPQRRGGENSLPHRDVGHTGSTPQRGGVEAENEGDYRGRAVGRREEVEVPPSVSPPTELSKAAQRALDQHAELLNGCRDSLRDYLRARVPLGRQLGFVQTVAGWRNGLRPGVWKRPDGSSVPADQQTKLLAAALNELSAMDESTLKRPPGETSNLQTKLEIIIKQEYSRGNQHRRASSGSRREVGTKKGRSRGPKIRGERLRTG